MSWSTSLSSRSSSSCDKLTVAQFAYNEASFFLVRLLQRFSTISLAPEAQPPASKPPARWANGVGIIAKEKIRPKAHLTLYVSVRASVMRAGLVLISLAGRTVVKAGCMSMRGVYTRVCTRACTSWPLLGLDLP